jgi:hypothetical protein
LTAVPTLSAQTLKEANGQRENRALANQIAIFENELAGDKVWCSTAALCYGCVIISYVKRECALVSCWQFFKLLMPNTAALRNRCVTSAQ